MIGPNKLPVASPYRGLAQDRPAEMLQQSYALFRLGALEQGWKSYPTSANHPLLTVCCIDKFVL